MKDNQDGSDKTHIDYLGFIGTPVSATNMADFKRVSFTNMDAIVFVSQFSNRFTL